MKIEKIELQVKGTSFRFNEPTIGDLMNMPQASGYEALGFLDVLGLEVKNGKVWETISYKDLPVTVARKISEDITDFFTQTASDSYSMVAPTPSPISLSESGDSLAND